MAATDNLGWSRGVKVEQHCDPEITDIVQLPRNFKPHLGWEFMLVTGWQLRKLAKVHGDDGWKGVSGEFRVRLDGKFIMQKFIFVTKRTCGRRVAHEIGHTRQPLGYSSPRQHLASELDAWAWSVERRRQLGRNEYNDLALILDCYREKYGFSPKITLREARVVLNRMGRGVPDDIWDTVVRWLEAD